MNILGRLPNLKFGIFCVIEFSIFRPSFFFCIDKTINNYFKISPSYKTTNIDDIFRKNNPHHNVISMKSNRNNNNRGRKMSTAKKGHEGNEYNDGNSSINDDDSDVKVLPDADIKNNKNHKKSHDDHHEKKKRQQIRGKSKWITCSSSNELAQAISDMVLPDDYVAELGSQLRDVSTTICKSLDKNRGGRATLVDIVRKFPKSIETRVPRTKAMRRPNDKTDFAFLEQKNCNDSENSNDVATFHEIDSLSEWRKAFFFSNDSNCFGTTSQRNYDVLVLDVSSIVGNDLEWTSLSIIQEFVALNQNYCKLVIVKSMTLNSYATNLMHGQEWNSKISAMRTTISSSTAAEEKEEQDEDKTASKENDKSRYRDDKHNRRHSHQNIIPNIIATVGVKEYRSTIPYSVCPGDAVLEVGCHLGTSTKLLHDYCTSSPSLILNTTAAANESKQSKNKDLLEKKESKLKKGYCIGVDVGTKIIKGAQQRHRDVHFAVGNAYHTANLLRIQQNYHDYTTAKVDNDANSGHDDDNGYTSDSFNLDMRCSGSGGGDINKGRKIGFDVIYIDVGGLSSGDGLFESLALISSYIYAFEPRSIVIKSLCMKRLSSTLVPYWKFKKENKI